MTGVEAGARAPRQRDGTLRPAHGPLLCALSSSLHSGISLCEASSVDSWVVLVTLPLPGSVSYPVVDTHLQRLKVRLRLAGVWVLNCVGLLNYKAFLLFLAHTFAASGLAAGLLAGTFVGIIRGLEAGTQDPR